MNIPQKNEASLLKKARNGDKDAFNLMVIKYQPRIMSVLYGFLKTHSDAEDLTQQTFLRHGLILKSLEEIVVSIPGFIE